MSGPHQGKRAAGTAKYLLLLGDEPLLGGSCLVPLVCVPSLSCQLPDSTTLATPYSSPTGCGCWGNWGGGQDSPCGLFPLRGYSRTLPSQDHK